MFKKNIMFSSFSICIILSACQTNDIKQDGIYEPEISIDDSLEYSELYTLNVIDEFSRNEEPKLTDYIISINSIEELEEHNPDAQSHLASNGLELDDTTFQNQKVWYLRLYGNKEVLPALIITDLYFPGNETGILKLQEIGSYVYEFSDDNIYCYSEFVFTTDKTIDKIQIQLDYIIE